LKQYYVYILANGWRGTLYVGVTSDLIKRVWQHRESALNGFTDKYKVKTLVWFETHQFIDAAISREKAIKAWKRAWKIELIEQINPKWQDLYASLL
jgi:putative endonuclease